jgi:hypothetical protein
MQDPHVKTLVYELRHSDDLDYEKAVPLRHDIGVCVLNLDAGKLKCEMKEHYADKDLARVAVEPFLQAWTVSAGLELGPNVIDFSFVDAEIVDRDPQPGAIYAHSSIHRVTCLQAKVHQSRTQYPTPPNRFVVDQSVSDMYDFYQRYREGRERLSLMGYMVFQVFCYESGGIREAAERYSVSETVLRKLSNLTSNKGGRDEGRKGPYSEPYTAFERQWVEQATKSLIRRAAEYAADTGAQLAELSMADLPPLS